MTAPMIIDPTSSVGTDCSIDPSVVIGPSVAIGDRVTIGPGAVLVGPARIGNDCQLGPAAVLDASGAEHGATLELDVDVQVMAGVTIAAAVSVARGARIQPGTVVQRDVPPHAVVAGNPAEIVGYALSLDAGDDAREAPSKGTGRTVGVTESLVRGVTFHSLPRIMDLRGNLTVGEFDRSIPFQAKRYFMVFGVPNAEIRGEHAHRTCKQFLICAQGSCNVVVDDGDQREEFVLDDPASGLYLPALTWGIQYKYSPDAVLIVFASEYYDNAEYIRDYGEFRELTASRRA